jgi:hypothetical protein
MKTTAYDAGLPTNSANTSLKGILRNLARLTPGVEKAMT